MGLLPTVALTLAMLADPSGPAAADLASRTVSVRLHDYSHLSVEEVAAAERQVSDIYAAIGVVVDWRLPVRPDDLRRGDGVWPSDPAASLAVLIISATMASGIGLKADVAGYAAVSPDDGGSVAFAVASRTRRIADCGNVPHARVLSSVIAHELAHLLMPRRVHSAEGIMRANWQPSEFRSMLLRSFSPAEADDIRQAVAHMHLTAAPSDN